MDVLLFGGFHLEKKTLWLAVGGNVGIPLEVVTITARLTLIIWSRAQHLVITSYTRTHTNILTSACTEDRQHSDQWSSATVLCRALAQFCLDQGKIDTLFFIFALQVRYLGAALPRLRWGWGWCQVFHLLAWPLHTSDRCSVLQNTQSTLPCIINWLQIVLSNFTSPMNLLKHTSLLLSNRHSNTAFVHNIGILVWKGLQNACLW